MIVCFFFSFVGIWSKCHAEMFRGKFLSFKLLRNRIIFLISLGSSAMWAFRGIRRDWSAALFLSALLVFSIVRVGWTSFF